MRTLRLSAFSLLSLIPVLGLGCSGDEGDSEPVTVDDTGSSCVSDDDCLSNEICDETAACVTGDRDNDAASATPLQDDGEDTHYYTGSGHIEPAGDVDWYAYTSLGGHFVRVDTIVDDEELDTDLLDTVVTIYDPAGNLLAQEDEHPAGSVGTYDSVAFAYLAEAGTYTITVEDVAGRSAPDVTYTLSVKNIGSGGDEPDSVQTTGSSLGLTGADLWYSVPVVLNRGDGTADTADYVRLTLPWSDTFLGFVTTLSPNGSDLTEALTLYNSAGTVVMRKDDPSVESVAGICNSEDDSYVLKVEDVNGGGGSTYWGIIFALVREEGYGNARESEPNEAPGQAEALVAQDQNPDVGSWVAGYGSGHIDTLNDVDVWTLNVDFDGAYLSVFYGAQTYGGLLLANVEIVGSDDTIVATMDATEGTDGTIWNAGPVPAGVYTVRFSGSDANTAYGEGAFYQFAFHASTSPLEP